MTKKIISILFIFLMCLTITGCQSKEEKEKINRIANELLSEVPKNLHLLNDEEYTITEISQCKQKEFPLSEEEYNDYDVNENTYFFRFKIETENNKKSELYVLYYSDRSYLSDYKYYLDVASRDDLRKFIIMSKTGNSVPVFFFLHYHEYDYSQTGKDLIYRCKFCHVVEQLYDVETESFVAHEASQEELQERVDKEKQLELKGVELAAYAQIKIKGASSYEITKVTGSGNFYGIYITASNGQTGVIKATKAGSGITLYDDYNHSTAGGVVYDLANNRIDSYWILWS